MTVVEMTVVFFTFFALDSLYQNEYSKNSTINLLLEMNYYYYD